LSVDINQHVVLEKRHVWLGSSGDSRNFV